MDKKKFYITTPIYYANGSPHLGHAYTTIAADVLARFQLLYRQSGNIFFSAGMDEHGLKIQESAKREGKDPQVFVNEKAEEFKTLFERLNIRYSRFIRTTDASHKKSVQNALQTLYDKGAIKKGVYKGLYCVGCEQFITPSQLVDGKCPDHNLEPEELEEESYLLDLENIQEVLIEKIKKDEFKISPTERKNEILSFLKNQRLKNVAISRNKDKVSWGIELPFDKNHVTYVWVDAFLNYLTVLGWDGSAENIPELFPPDIQLVGKDILRVHATIWPAILIHLGINLPKEIFAHGMIISGGRKMSKTLGNVISPYELIDKFGVDATRYLLMSAGTFGSDPDITMERVAEKYTAELVNGIGNVVSRVTNIAEKNFNGNVKLKILNKKEDFVRPYRFSRKNLISNNPSQGCIEIHTLEIVLNDYISRNKPWELIKNNKEKTEEIIFNLLEGIRIMAYMLYPFMPETSEKIFEKLGLDAKVELAKTFDEAVKWGSVEFKNVKKGEGLFPRLQ